MSPQRKRRYVMSQVLGFFGPMRSPVVVICAVLAVNVAAFGQKTSGGSSTPPSTSADSDNAEQFAIESEMLTYTAMDSEGTALACNLGKNVGAAGANCNVLLVNGPRVGVVVVRG